VRRNERGQIVVVFAGSLLVLMVIAAIVIDLGSVWMMKRHEQNAADPGAVAAARWIRDPGNGGNPTVPNMWTAACSYALKNNLNPIRVDNSALCDSGQASDESSITVNYPPSMNAGQYAGHVGFVEVIISRPDHSFFAGLFGRSIFQVTASAVAAFSNGDSNSSSLVALDPHACAALQIGGNSTVNIHTTTPGTNGGYIQVNSDCKSPGTTDGLCPGGPQGAMKINGSGTVTAPHTYVRGTCISPGGGVLLPSGELTEGADYVADPIAGLQPPAQGTGADCGDVPLTTTDPTTSKGCTFKGSNIYELYPGTYYGGWKVQTGGSPTINLHPGIYVIAGGGIDASNGTIESVAGPSGDPDTARVLIYSTDNIAGGYQPACKAGTASKINDQCQQLLQFTAGSTLIVKGLDSSPCPPVSTTGCPYAGMLLWQDAGGSKTKPSSHDISIQAGANLNIGGTIYSATGDVSLLGSPSATGGCSAAPYNCAAVQIIANTITVGGGAGLDMPYDPSELYHLDQKGLVH
jgi:hypothetical protein